MEKPSLSLVSDAIKAKSSPDIARVVLQQFVGKTGIKFYKFYKSN